MEIKVLQEKLAKALNNVSKIAAGARTTLPILNNVLIRVEETKVSLTTTNLDMAVVSYLPTTGGKNGVITLPARLVAEFVSNLPRGELVSIITNSDKVTITAAGYSSTINGAPADDFPELPEIDEDKAVKLSLKTEDFKLGISQVIFAASNDTTRPALTGVNFNTFEGGLYVAATDGYRLTEKKIADKVKDELSVIVPVASLKSVLGLINDEMDEIEIVFDESQVRFRFGDIELTSKLVDGSFPDYRQLIPKNITVKVELEKSELTRVTKLAALFAREVGGAVLCKTDAEKNVLTINSVANELGENSSEIKAEVSEDREMYLNARFLLEVFNVMLSDKVSFEFGNQMDPLTIKGDDDPGYVHIVMPLRR